MKWITVSFFIIALSGLDTVDQNQKFSINASQTETIHQALDSIYNMNFIEADLLIIKLENELPEYPGIDLLRAVYYQWKYKPLYSRNPVYQKFLHCTDETLAKSDQLLQKNGNSFEAYFYMLSIHAMLARLYVDTGFNWKAILEVQKAYRILKMAMEKTEQFPDFNLYCGIYNYYREKYPEDNPFVKPVLWFFMSGDKETGLRMLDSGANLGLFTRVECLTYLFHINFRYEFRPQKSIEYAALLYASYPSNDTFLSLLIENLIYLDRFAETKTLIDKIENSDENFYRFLGKIFEGLVTELYDKNLELAMEYYFDAKKIGTEYNVETPHYTSLYLLGLGRIFLKQGNIMEAREYLKKAAKISEYGFVRDEANGLLRKITLS